MDEFEEDLIAACVVGRGGIGVAGLVERGLGDAGLSYTELDATYAAPDFLLAVGRGSWWEIAMLGVVAQLTVLAMSERYEETRHRVRGRRDARDCGGEIDRDRDQCDERDECERQRE